MTQLKKKLLNTKKKEKRERNRKKENIEMRNRGC
jgi:hypothetical protein